MKSTKSYRIIDAYYNYKGTNYVIVEVSGYEILLFKAISHENLINKQIHGHNTITSFSLDSLKKMIEFHQVVLNHCVTTGDSYDLAVAKVGKAFYSSNIPEERK